LDFSVTTEALGAGIKDYFGGVQVVSLVEGGEAERLGLEVGDLITSCGPHRFLPQKRVPRSHFLRKFSRLKRPTLLVVRRADPFDSGGGDVGCGGGCGLGSPSSGGMGSPSSGGIGGSFVADVEMSRLRASMRTAKGDRDALNLVLGSMVATDEEGGGGGVAGADGGGSGGLSGGGSMKEKLRRASKIASAARAFSSLGPSGELEEGAEFVLTTLDVVVTKSTKDPSVHGQNPTAVSAGGALLERTVDGRNLRVAAVPSSYSPAAGSGVKTGDTLVAVNQVAISKQRDPHDASRFTATPLLEPFLKQLDKTKRPMTLTFQRKVRPSSEPGGLSSSPLNAAATTGSSSSSSPASRMAAGSPPLNGAANTANNATPRNGIREIALVVPDKPSGGWKGLKVEAALRGGSVEVKFVEPYGPGHRIGFRVGDKVVASGNGKKISLPPPSPAAVAVSSSSLLKTPWGSKLTKHPAGTLGVSKFHAIVAKNARPGVVVVERKGGASSAAAAANAAAAAAAGAAAAGQNKFKAGDHVTWKGSDEDVPNGTVGTVVIVHSDGDVEVKFHNKKDPQQPLRFTFRPERLDHASRGEKEEEKAAEREREQREDAAASGRNDEEEQVAAAAEEEEGEDDEDVLELPSLKTSLKGAAAAVAAANNMKMKSNSSSRNPSILFQALGGHDSVGVNAGRHMEMSIDRTPAAVPPAEPPAAAAPAAPATHRHHDQLHIHHHQQGGGGGCCNGGGNGGGGVVGVQRVLVLLNMLDAESLVDDGEFGEILEDVTAECNEFGELVEVFIPRPSEGDEHGIGKVFVEFASEEGAAGAAEGLGGRDFDGHTIETAFLDPQLFDQGKLDDHSRPTSHSGGGS
jgi:hypothetical protein